MKNKSKIDGMRNLGTGCTKKLKDVLCKRFAKLNDKELS